MIYALALLLFSSLTCVGLLSIWAATSPWHWFLRTMLFLGVISLVLLIPAYEPFVAFLLQGVVVTSGVQLARWWRERNTNSAELRTRFALGTILLAMIPLAVVSALAVRLPDLNLRAWQSVVLIGLCAGGASLTGLWIALGPGVRWWWRVLIGSVIAGGLSLALVWGDWFIASIHSMWSWPPPQDNGADWYLDVYDDHHETAWISIVCLLVGCVALVQWLLASFITPKQKVRQQSVTLKRRLSFATLLLIAIVLLVPTSSTYYELMNPLPIPEQNPPTPNGYDDFLAAVSLLPANLIVNGGNFDSDTATLGQLRAVESEMAPAIERVRIGLTKSIWNQLDFQSDDLVMDEVGALRTIARGFYASGKLAEKENDISLAAENYLHLLQFGSGIGQGGLIVDVLVGIACTGIGCDGLYNLRDEVPSTQCHSIASNILEIESTIEPFEDTIYRDRAWMQHVYGWHSHLEQSLESVSGESVWSSAPYYSLDQRNHAVLRLLQLEFALRAWKAEHNEWPESLAELVPAIIPAVPVDPFSPDSNPLKYLRTTDDYVLYSVGQNEIDEDGKAPEDDGSGWRDPGTGDLRLDIHFAPDPSVNVGTGDEDAEGE